MSQPTLQRQVGLWSAIAVVIGTTIGSGIFRSPAGIATKLPGPLPMGAVWVVGGLLALCGALSLSEAASAFPRTGGVYAFVKEGFGKLPAFMFGWAEVTVIRASSVGAIAITFAEYFLRSIKVDPSTEANHMTAKYIAAGAIIAMGMVNIWGVKWGTLVLNLTTLAKYGGLLFIVMLAFALGLPETGGHYTPAMPEGSFSISMFGLALVSVLWAYDGWADLSYAAGEVKDPERNLPRALIGGTLAIIAIYLLANLAYLAVLPINEISQSRLVAADVAEKLMGQAGVAFVSITVMLSTFGTLTGSLFTSPRIFFAMAEDGLFFKFVAKVHPKYHTPHIAIGINIVLAVIFVLFLSFEQLADAFVTAIVPFYALSVAALFVFRRRPEYKPAFRTPGYPVVPALFVISTIALLANGLIDASSRTLTAVALGMILLGIPVYYLTVGRNQGVSKA
jgi:APA family basic amino acid/polyamine antiporter